MARIAYTHEPGRAQTRGRKYPFDQLRDIGDYFDAPAECKHAVQVAASLIGGRLGKRFTAFKVAAGAGTDAVRVMLVEIDDGAR